MRSHVSGLILPVDEDVQFFLFCRGGGGGGRFQKFPNARTGGYRFQVFFSLAKSVILVGVFSPLQNAGWT